MIYRKAVAVVLSVVIIFCIGTMVAGCYVDEAQKNYQEHIAEMQEQVDSLKERIDYLEKELEKGKFFTLAQAYEKGWLTTEDLQIIADYHHGVVPCEESLSDDVASVIKEASIPTIKARFNLSEATTDDVVILKCYGTYNRCVVAIVDYIHALYAAVDAPIDVEIGGVTFTFQRCAPSVVVWII